MPSQFFNSDGTVGPALPASTAPRTLTHAPLSQPRSREALVERVSTLLREHLGEPLSVADLSRMVGVSERTLRSAFHDVVGISPKKYAIHQRLEAAHRALCEAKPGTTTVTDIAMTFGFFELGRFAGRYRSAFGEVPSRTLRQTTTDAQSWIDDAA